MQEIFAKNIFIRQQMEKKNNDDLLPDREETDEQIGEET